MSRMKTPPPSVTINACMTPGDPGGVANYTYHLVHNLRNCFPYMEITLVSPANLRSYFVGLRGVRHVFIPLHSQFIKFFLNQLLVPWIARRSELLHSVGNYGIFLRGKAQTIFVHDTYEQESRDRFGAPKRFLLAFLISATGRRSRAVLTNSENTRRDIARHYPHLAAKTVVTRLGTKFPVAPGEPMESRTGFLFVGTLEPGKRLSDIFEAYSMLPAACRKHPIRVVGQPGWGESNFGKKAVVLGIDPNVEFTGHVSDERLRTLYQTSLALVQASSYEGFGLPVVEAMACGCPVIAAENSALAEVGKGAALFFPTGDVRALARIMERLIDDLTLREECSRNSLARAADFTWEATAKATLEAFRQAVA